MRKAKGMLALVAGLALMLALAGTAMAQDNRGNHGTVKIHDGDTEVEPIQRNMPHVGCDFHIHGFKFNPGGTGEWDIQSWPPTGDRSVVVSGSWGPADGEGEWRTEVMSLPDGHYKLNWKQTSPPTPGGSKHKVFWVECAAAVEAEEQPGAAAEEQPEGAVAGEERPPVAFASPEAVPPADVLAAERPPAGVVLGIEALPITSTATTVTGAPGVAGAALLMAMFARVMARRSARKVRA